MTPAPRCRECKTGELREILQMPKDIIVTYQKCRECGATYFGKNMVKHE